jgi:hypothetical protein
MEQCPRGLSILREPLGFAHGSCKIAGPDGSRLPRVVEQEGERLEPLPRPNGRCLRLRSEQREAVGQRRTRRVLESGIGVKMNSGSCGWARIGARRDGIVRVELQLQSVA